MSENDSNPYQGVETMASYAVRKVNELYEFTEEGYSFEEAAHMVGFSLPVAIALDKVIGCAGYLA